MLVSFKIKIEKKIFFIIIIIIINYHYSALINQIIIGFFTQLLKM